MEAVRRSARALWLNLIDTANSGPHGQAQTTSLLLVFGLACSLGSLTIRRSPYTNVLAVSCVAAFCVWAALSITYNYLTRRNRSRHPVNGEQPGQFQLLYQAIAPFIGFGALAVGFVFAALSVAYSRQVDWSVPVFVITVIVSVAAAALGIGPHIRRRFRSGVQRFPTWLFILLMVVIAPMETAAWKLRLHIELTTRELLGYAIIPMLVLGIGGLAFCVMGVSAALLALNYRRSHGQAYLQQQPRTMPELLRDLQSSLYPLGTAAMRELVMLGSEAVPVMVEILPNSNRETQVRIIGVLGKLKSSQAVQPIIDLLDSILSDQRRLTVRHTTRWLARREPNDDAMDFASGRRQVCLAAVHTLGEFGDKAAVNVLIKSLTDREDKVRHAAHQALGRLGKVGWPKLKTLLTDSDPVLRRGAVLALGYSGDPEVIPVISPLRDDRNAAVRRAVSQTLSRLAPQKRLKAVN